MLAISFRLLREAELRLDACSIWRYPKEKTSVNIKNRVGYSVDVVIGRERT